MLLKAFVIYLVLVNAAAFLLMLVDKYKAKKNTIVKYQVKVDAEARKKVEKED